MDDLTRVMVEAGLMEAPKTEAKPEVTDDVADELLASLMTEEVGQTVAPPTEIKIEAPAEVAPVAVEIVEADLELVATQIEVEENKMALYEEQESTVEIRDAAVTPTVEPEVAAVTERKRAAGSGRTSRLAGADAGTYFATLSGKDELRDVVNALPKKVKDKATNLADHLYNNRALSVYTKAAVDVLKTDGALTNHKLVEVLTTACQKKSAAGGYSNGTARSQAQQAITLLSKLGIAQIDARTVKPVAENDMWKALARV